MEEEELKKRNTDCVYFLASPLTCKKGIECEYRHSEIARFNPRDCWYWLMGSCLNPTCAFRHPPLDGHTEALSKSAVPPHYDCTVPVNKTNVPCYFYIHGFCNKGDKCSFLHGPDNSTLAVKSLKTASAVSNAVPSEKKISIGSDTGSTPVETHPNPSETAPNGAAAPTQIKPKQDFHQVAPDNVAERSASPHVSASECEEAAAVKSNSLLPAEGFIQSRSLVCTDQSSEEQVDGPIEREEWLESSPGFDVLVDDRSENLGYEDIPDYLLTLDREGREFNGKFMGDDYEDPVEYDPAYPDARILYEQEAHDSYDLLGNEDILDYTRNIPGHSRESMLDHINSAQKRKFLQMEMAFDGRSGIDLRIHLKKRRELDGHFASHFSRRHGSSRLVRRSRERPGWQGLQRQHGRLKSVVVNNFVGSPSENETLLNGVNRRGSLRRSHLNRSRQRYKEKRQGKHQFPSSGVSRKSASKKTSTEESTMFTGPKTLDQIKEEKKNAQENGDYFGKLEHSNRTISEDFQGPIPLEILKDKRRLCSVMERNQSC